MVIVSPAAAVNFFRAPVVKGHRFNFTDILSSISCSAPAPPHQQRATSATVAVSSPPAPGATVAPRRSPVADNNNSNGNSGGRRSRSRPPTLLQRASSVELLRPTAYWKTHNSEATNPEYLINAVRLFSCHGMPTHIALFLGVTKNSRFSRVVRISLPQRFTSWWHIGHCCHYCCWFFKNCLAVDAAIALRGSRVRVLFVVPSAGFRAKN